MKKQIKNSIAIIILLAVAVLLYFSYSSQGFFYFLIHQDVNSVADFINSFGAFAEIIFILIVILEVVLAPIPPLAIYVAAGILFGAFWGGILTLVGNMIGSVIDFKIARTYGRNLVERKVNEKLRTKFDKFSEKYGSYSIFFLRLNPFTSSDLFSYLAGLTKIKTWKFILGTFLGLAPLIFVQTYFGDYFVKENQFLFSLVIVVSLIYVVLLIYILIKMFFSKNHNNSYK